MRRVAYYFFKYAGLVVGFVCILIFLFYVLETWTEHMEFRELLGTGQVNTVVGYVENFHPMPYGGHDTEHFDVNGVFFEYSDYDATHNGYHTSASHGGVIRQNGQYLKLKYITLEYSGGNKNIILYIAEPER